MQHAAQYGLLAHQIGLHFRDEGRFQYAGSMSSRGGGISFGNLQTVSIRIVLCVNRDQSRHTKATFIFFPDFTAGAFGGNHYDSEIIAHPHALLDNVEAVRVGQASPLLHQRHHLINYIAVLLVRC